MADWLREFDASYRFMRVSRATGAEVSELEGFEDGGSISRNLDTDVYESASATCEGGLDVGADLVRVYLDADFGGEVERVALGTFVPERAEARRFGRGGPRQRVDAGQAFRAGRGRVRRAVLTSCWLQPRCGGCGDMPSVRAGRVGRRERLQALHRVDVRPVPDERRRGRQQAQGGQRPARHRGLRIGRHRPDGHRAHAQVRGA